MKRLKRILHKLLFPGAAVVLLSVPIAAGLLAYTFLAAGDSNPIAYVSYVISAYSLTIVCVNLFPIIRKGSQWVSQHPVISRYLGDIPFKLRLSLYASLGINLLYAGVNAFSGIYYRSPWFGSLAAYYILLSIMRFMLVRHAHRNGFGENQTAEWKRYRACGGLLAVMNIALAGVVILVIQQNRGFEYAGTLIYVMAMYTFYITIMAVVNVVRHRKFNSPVMSAARAINLVAALVSMLSLETAMLTQFDTGDTPLYFRQIMTGTTGGAVCVFVIGMGLYMIGRSTKQLKQLRNNRLET